MENLYIQQYVLRTVEFCNFSIGPCVVPRKCVSVIHTEIGKRHI